MDALQPTISDLVNQSKIEYLEMVLDPGRIDASADSFLLLLEDLLHLSLCCIFLTCVLV
jgi:hypothetical protein